MQRVMPGRVALQQAVPRQSDEIHVDPQVIEDQRQLVADTQTVKRAQLTADQNALVALGTDTVVDLTNSIFNPQDLGGAVLPTILIQFVVPQGTVFVLRKLGVTYSNPFVAMSRAVGWRVTVNGHRVSWIYNINDEYFYSSFGTVTEPLDIEPLVVGANGRLAVEVYPRFGFNDSLTMSARISGKIVKPANPESTGVTG
jgi:hypothetical protein